MPISTIRVLCFSIAAALCASIAPSSLVRAANEFRQSRSADPEGTVEIFDIAGAIELTGWNRPEIVGWPDEKLVAAVRAELRIAQGVKAEPVFVHIVRWENAIPQYLLGHPELVAAIEERAAKYPGLILGGNAYRGVALNDCTEQGELLAVKVRQTLTSLRLPGGET